MRNTPDRIVAALVVVACIALSGARATAQEAATPSAPAAGAIETDPIRCWWRTSKSAVLVGERFMLTLTCAVVETTATKVLPDLNQLEPTVVQLAPFEVVNGVRHEDLLAPPWRYFQHEYAVRLLGDTYFGKDVDIPPVKVTYHIESAIGGGAEGRDQTYILPALPMRIDSLLPRKASDIRDGWRETFADIEARRFRVTAELVAAAICFGFALVFLVLALARVISRHRVRTPAIARPLPTGVVLAGGLRALRRITSEVARDGWTPALVSHALSVLRIAAAVALGRPVAQVVVDTKVPGREGQLVLGKGILRRKRALVSAPTTPDPLAQVLADNNPDAPSARMQSIVVDLKDALRVFSTARYGRDTNLDTAAIDAALETGASAIRRLRFATLWPMRTAGALKKSASGLGGMVWSR